MKTTLYIVMALFVLTAATVYAQAAKTEQFDVKGNCSMCENRIEKAAQSVKGVVKADWNMKTSLIDVTFDPSKTNVDKIQSAIAGAGHDTPLYKAKDEVYNRLPACCKYDRAGNKAGKSEPTKHDH